MRSDMLCKNCALRFDKRIYDKQYDYCPYCGTELVERPCRHYSFHSCGKGKYQCNDCHDYFTIKPYSTKSKKKGDKK